MKKTAAVSFPSYYLFPVYFFWIGLFLVVLGLVSTYFYFWGGRPDFFTTKTFALYSSYVETKYCTISQTNWLNEMGAVFCIVGLFLIGFSKTKNENNIIGQLRLKSLLLSLYVTIGVWVFVSLFVFGWPIFVFAFFTIYFFLIVYILIFRIKLIELNKLK